MAHEPLRVRAERLRRFSADLALLADDVEQASRSICRAEMLITEGERISAGVRAVFRGSCSR